MFKSFFGSKAWWLWAWPGVALIVVGLWCQVRIDVLVNSGIGSLFDVMQRSLSEPGSVTLDLFDSIVWDLTNLILLYVGLATLLGFYIKHWILRWRQAMNDLYTRHWAKLRLIEGASQRVQEDTKRLAATVELIGASLIESMLTLLAFLPILWDISTRVHQIPIVGKVDHALVYIAILYALIGTIGLAIVGYKLPGLEFLNQKAEAAYRKELVYAEDDASRAEMSTFQKLFDAVKKNYHRLFFHYMYFDLSKLIYLAVWLGCAFYCAWPNGNCWRSYARRICSDGSCIRENTDTFSSFSA